MQPLRRVIFKECRPQALFAADGTIVHRPIGIVLHRPEALFLHRYQHWRWYLVCTDQ